ncbi:MAG: hypothetical protein NC307_15470 [Roseburia sp.]|nr:hypothetical protein [Roseburia sp.]
MGRYILTICDDITIFNNLREKWLEDGITGHMASDFSDAVNVLSENPAFLLIVAFLDEQNSMPPFQIIRKMTKAPILVLRKGYDSMEKAAMIEAGADEYIAWTDDYLIETVASGKALIRRYTEFSQSVSESFHILSHGSLFMSADYRKVFVHAQETLKDISIPAGHTCHAAISMKSCCCAGSLTCFISASNEPSNRAKCPAGMHGYLATAARVKSQI